MIPSSLFIRLGLNAMMTMMTMTASRSAMISSTGTAACGYCFPAVSCCSEAFCHSAVSCYSEVSCCSLLARSTACLSAPCCPPLSHVPPGPPATSSLPTLESHLRTNLSKLILSLSFSSRSPPCVSTLSSTTNLESQSFLSLLSSCSPATLSPRPKLSTPSSVPTLFNEGRLFPYLMYGQWCLFAGVCFCLFGGLV